MDYLKIIFIGVITMTFFSCKDISEVRMTTCNDFVTVDEELYQNSFSDDLDIESISISGDCYNIVFWAGGCDGSTWVLELVDSGEVLYSNPPRRNILLILDNPELCEAYIKREMSFDIIDLQSGGEEVKLYLDNNGEVTSYYY